MTSAHFHHIDLSKAKPIPRLFSPSDPPKPRKSPKQYLSAAGLIKEIRSVFEKIPVYGRQRKVEKSGSSQLDCLMAGYALFSLKYPSLLQFETEARADGPVAKNLATLYGVNKVPSDTYMRE